MTREEKKLLLEGGWKPSQGFTCPAWTRTKDNITQIVSRSPGNRGTWLLHLNDPSPTPPIGSLKAMLSRLIGRQTRI